MKRLFSILDYVPVVATVCGGAYVSFLSFKGPMDEKHVLGSILTMVTLIATSLLFEKIKLTRRLLREKKLADLEKCTRLLKESERPELTDLMSDVKSIDILAWSGLQFYNSNEELLKEKAREGVKIRILITAVGSASELIKKNSEHKEIEKDLEAMLERYGKLQDFLGKTKGKNVLIRGCDWVAPFGMLVVHNKHSKILSISPQPLYVPTSYPDNRRFFLVDAKENPEDFEYFSGQFERIWKDDSRSKSVGI